MDHSTGLCLHRPGPLWHPIHVALFHRRVACMLQSGLQSRPPLQWFRIGSTESTLNGCLNGKNCTTKRLKALSCSLGLCVQANGPSVTLLCTEPPLRACPHRPQALARSQSSRKSQDSRSQESQADWAVTGLRARAFSASHHDSQEETELSMDLRSLSGSQ